VFTPLNLIPKRFLRGLAAGPCYLTPAPVSVESLNQAPEVFWQTVRVRPTERSEWCDRFAARRGWTVYARQAVQVWLMMRREAKGRYS
jgi:hypothetical protein